MAEQVDVRRQDQTAINQFSGLNRRLKELEAETDALKVHDFAFVPVLHSCVSTPFLRSAPLLLLRHHLLLLLLRSHRLACPFFVATRALARAPGVT